MNEDISYFYYIPTAFFGEYDGAVTTGLLCRVCPNREYEKSLILAYKLSNEGALGKLSFLLISICSTYMKKILMLILCCIREVVHIYL